MKMETKKTSNSNQTKKNKWLTTDRIIIIGGILALIAPYLFTRNLGLISFENTGQIGDTIGGITSPIVGLLGAYLVYKALQAQIDANEELRYQFRAQQNSTLHALQLQVESNKLVENQFQQQLKDAIEQRQLLVRQNFEPSFFQMLSMQQDIIRRMHMDLQSVLGNLSHYIKPEKMTKIYQKHINGKKSLLKDLEVFEYTTELLLELITIQHIDLSMDYSYMVKFEPIKLHEKTHNFSYKSMYSILLEQMDSNVDMYFRNLTMILEMIESQKFHGQHEYSKEFETKYYYASIVKAQLSNYEAVWIFFAGLNESGIRLRSLITKYGLLEILSNSQESEIQIMKSLYSDSAYKKYNPWNDPNRGKPMKK